MFDLWTASSMNTQRVQRVVDNQGASLDNDITDVLMFAAARLTPSGVCRVRQLDSVSANHEPCVWCIRVCFPLPE